ncbi:uncharacterized protein FRV6_14227 [Fusarium oxysporum]|uniref:Uncharacterized protein n=1 Tax=Fusarium oxysporum TaxID=5507 RepID=A0A2H3U7U1_FUSOX|nr:uncharacterized protein FRV6_14227 [Fusarium oxysporum]
MPIRCLINLQEVRELVYNSKRHSTELILFFNAIARKEALRDKELGLLIKIGVI